ncbi:abortive infection family protein [Novipirellula sp.]|uniref:abortive infection family protein n=1 Tax=Novipirellula sp. TaxID=2795430 RepID=UPI0035693385
MRKQRPPFSDVGPRKDDLDKIFCGMSGIMDATNPIRNEGSMAHANNDLLDSSEAGPFINMAQTG